ncbi:hypothetical protein HY989_01895 [Candidatus Micrarchaeota archaeon]|nr:hypothetical protein [Candidatus Micrarchaeota archaeon]
METTDGYKKLYVALPSIGYDSNSQIGEKTLEFYKIQPDLIEMGIEPMFFIGGKGCVIPTEQATIELTRSSGKGFLLKNCISHAKFFKYDYFICCDGSGKIPFENIIKVAKLLKEETFNCIIGKRDSVSGISEERMTVESFENYLIEKKFKLPSQLKDAQCGCWGYSLKQLGSISLTSDGYEAELDFITEALGHPDAKLRYCSIDVENTGITKFNHTAHSSKLHFLQRKLQLKKEEIISLSREFEADHSKKLPSEYSEILGALPKEMDVIGKEIEDPNNNHKQS